MNIRPILVFSVYCLLAALSLPVKAGQASKPSNPANASPARQQAPIKTLEDDPRLNVKVSIQRDAITVAKALQRLTVLTKIRLRVRGEETSTSLIVFRYRNARLREIMESLGSAKNLEWIYDAEGVWVASSAYDASRLDIHRPRTPAQADLGRLGEKLVEQMNQLPANLQEGLANAPQAGFDPADRSTVLNMFGIPFAALPETMQQTLQEMVDLKAQDAGWTGEKPPPSTDYRDARVRFGKPSHQEGFDAYSISLSSGYFEKPEGNATSLGMRNQVNIYFNVFQHPRDQDNRIVSLDQALGGSASPFGEKDAASRKEAIKHDGRFEAKVSLNVDSVRFRAALLALASSADISVAAPDNGNATQPKRKWALDQVALKDALDRIAEAYGYTWGVSKGATIVFHPSAEANRSASNGLSSIPVMSK